MDHVFVGENTEAKLYIGNLDMRITEAALLKMFSPFGKIVHEEFLLHTRGRKRGEPRGFAFIQYSSEEFLISTIKVSMQEAKLAKEKMHGRLACGRPLVVRLSSEKYSIQETENPSRQAGNATKTSLSASSSGQMSRTSKIAAIKNKLKALEGEGFSAKKQKQDNASCSSSLDHPSGQR
ncbi:putative nucleotide-binding alpha-beta plait domain-containing protein [Rosa chinensis]|uniref:Putative nucleotide-binding alpha-beta plait domain-containing protein n=1 Tax=Rosa chinensis TaxID=74649 RepID=A0A2P6SN80_ROSCH|nr:putative nucleotide-binding alpha-beta plait domain-containing protein [Rosa chinensis]